MCNRAQSRPRKWAVAMGSTTEPIGSRSGEVLSASPSRASIPSLGLRCSQPRLRGTGVPPGSEAGEQVIWGIPWSWALWDGGSSGSQGTPGQGWGWFSGFPAHLALANAGHESLLRSVQFPRCALEDGAPLAAEEDCWGTQKNLKLHCA